MSCSGKVSRKFEFLRGLWAAEKIQAKVQELLRKFKTLLRKIKKKLKLTALASQQSSLVLSQYKCSVLPGTQNSNVENFFPELDKNLPMSS